MLSVSASSLAISWATTDCVKSFACPAYSVEKSYKTQKLRIQAGAWLLFEQRKDIF
ncbi:hypothetical protein [Treponema bryantii]|uniref:hypothetical protein n=1 Tax=Treponema bryantii TaxID=163 RepID=UPI0003B5D62B|nr:hypothetical protein [Treponema bryantii]